MIQRLWGAYVENNRWHEPSGLCTDFSLQSITTIQGWLVWSAIHARWLVRCEYLSVTAHDISTTVLQRFYSVLLLWKSLDQGSLPLKVIQITCDCLKDILR